MVNQYTPLTIASPIPVDFSAHSKLKKCIRLELCAHQRYSAAQTVPRPELELRPPSSKVCVSNVVVSQFSRKVTQ